MISGIEITNHILSADALQRMNGFQYRESAILCLYTAFENVVVHCLWVARSIDGHFETDNLSRYSSLCEIVTGSPPPEGIIEELTLATAVRNEIAHPFPYKSRAQRHRPGLQPLVTRGLLKIGSSEDPEMYFLTGFSDESILGWFREVCFGALKHIDDNVLPEYESTKLYLRPEMFEFEY